MAAFERGHRRPGRFDTVEVAMEAAEGFTRSEP
jgi:hypothetical protein